MKKLLSIILSLACLAFFFSCDNGSTPEPDPIPEPEYCTITYTSEFDTEHIPGPQVVEKGSLFTESLLPTLNEPGYDLKYWINSNSQICNLGDPINSDMTLRAQWEIKDVTVTYTVEHYQENIYDDNFTLVDKETKKAKWGTSTDPTLLKKDYEGFLPKYPNSEKIAFDGSTVVKIKYTRKIYKIEFDTGAGSKIDSIIAKYGTPITPPENPTLEGYVFESWDKEIPQNIEAGDMLITAVWKDSSLTPEDPDADDDTPEDEPKPKISYTVKHYLESIYRYIDVEYNYRESTDLENTLGEMTEAVAKDYEGYTAKPFEQIKLESEEEQYTVEIYYDLNLSTLTFDTNGGSEIEPITDKCFYSTPYVQQPQRDGYIFDKWIPEIPNYMPLEDMSFVAQWIPNKITVSVDLPENPSDEVTLEDFSNNYNDSTRVFFRAKFAKNTLAIKYNRESEACKWFLDNEPILQDEEVLDDPEACFEFKYNNDYNYYELCLDITKHSQGKHTVLATIIDDDGNLYSSSIDFTIVYP